MVRPHRTGRRGRRYEHRGMQLMPSCAVSAHARDIDREEAIAAGFDMYLSKPLTPERLVEAVAELRHMVGATTPFELTSSRATP